MLWPIARTGNTDVSNVRAWMLWPIARTGNTDVIIVRAWMRWPIARTGHTDVINHRAGMDALANRTDWKQKRKHFRHANHAKHRNAGVFRMLAPRSTVNTDVSATYRNVKSGQPESPVAVVFSACEAHETL